MKKDYADMILNNKTEFEKIHNENNDLDISEADFSHSTIDDMDFTNIDFSGSTFLESTISNTNFTDCDLSSVDFSRATLTECNFSGAILNGTNFNYATVNYCNFSEADMAGCNLSEANLENSDFSTSENLDSCRFDESTLWPETEKLPEDFDCTYNYDLSSLREEDEQTEIY